MYSPPWLEISITSSPVKLFGALKYVINVLSIGIPLISYTVLLLEYLGLGASFDLVIVL